MIAARLPSDAVAWPALLVTAAAVVVLSVAVITAPASGSPGKSFARGAGLALELLLAAGLIRLAAIDSLVSLASVAAIVAVRQVIGRGVRAAGR